MPSERSTWDHASALSPFYLGQPAHPSRGQKWYPAVAADGAGTAAFRELKSLQPAPLLNLIVSRTSVEVPALRYRLIIAAFLGLVLGVIASDSLIRSKLTPGTRHF